MTWNVELSSVPRRAGTLLFPAIGLLGAVISHPACSAAGGTALQVEPSGGASAGRVAGLPLRFEPNLGQADQPVRFIARGPGYLLQLRSSEFYLTHSRTNIADVVNERPGTGHLPVREVSRESLRISLAGAWASAPMTGENRRPGVSHYLRGTRREGWLRDVPHFAAVTAHEVYPGIDVRYYGNQGRLEYDFILAPQADPGHIRLRFDRPERGGRPVEPALERGGGLVLSTGAAEMRQRPPVAYQTVNGRRRGIACAYRLDSEGTVRLALGKYDRSQALVIDPILTYSGYLGGVDDDAVLGVAADPFGNAYVTGLTSSVNFPVAAAIQPLQPDPIDAFVTKINASGSEVIYSTYLGGSVPMAGAGSSNDIGWGIAVDGAGNAHVVGSTDSDDFPTTAGSVQPVPLGGGGEAFVAKLNAAGDDFVYSTYLGGAEAAMDIARAIKLDVKGFAYVGGLTASPTFPTTPGSYQEVYGGGNSDGFLCKIPGDGASLEWCTFLGGGPSIKSSGDDYITSISLDPTAVHTSVVYAAGSTNAHNFPLERPLQITPTRFDGFITKFTDDGSAILYSTFLGGNRDEVIYGIAVDDRGAAYVVGTTASKRFENTPDPVQPYGGGDTDAFIARLHPKATHLEYFTFYGFKGTDLGRGIAVDSQGRAWVTGAVNYPNAATVLPGAPGARAGEGDGFTAARKADALVLEVAPALTRGGRFLTPHNLSGRNDETGNAIHMDAHGDIYVVGLTRSTDFPRGRVTTFQPSNAGMDDGFVAKYSLPPYGRIRVVPGGLSFSTRAGQSLVRTFRVLNVSRRTVGVTVTAPVLPFEILSGGGQFVLAPGGQRTVEVRYGSDSPGFFREHLRIVSTAAGARGDILMPLRGRTRP